MQATARAQTPARKPARNPPAHAVVPVETPPDIEEEPPAAPTAKSNMSFDANSVGFNKDLNRSVFDGNVVALGGGSLITADHVDVDNEKKVMDARGHVVVLAPGQVFLGDTMTYHWLTGDFRISDATMISNDPEESSKVANKLLGFTAKEMEFETERQKRLTLLKGRREEVRDHYRRVARFGDEPDPDIVDSYVLLLEQENLAASQENPALARMGKERRASFDRRRAYWNQGKLLEGAVAAPLAYFKIVGNELTRTNDNDFTAYDATWTPCRCDADESPAWGFHADQIDAQSEGYANLSHPVLEIKGVPILYLPFLKLPLKHRRQSGFLMPTLQTGNQANGTVYSQPVFLDLDKNLDATIETDVFERRGTKLGAEIRYEQRKYSGWTLKLENLRDRSWITARENRERTAEFYTANRPDCSEVNDVDKAECESLEKKHADPDHDRLLGEYFQTNLPVPSNTWRSKQEWRGRTFFAPRLSLVSHGQVYSDRRYVEDLTMTEDFEAALTPGAYASAYAPARARLHLDARDFYLGVGTSYGDSLQASGRRYDGYQTPVYFKVRSQYVSLDPARILPKTPYGELSVDQFRFEYSEALNLYQDPAAEPAQQLGDGTWQRTAFNQVMPIISDGVVRVDQFSEWEARQITHSKETGGSSSIRSYRAGLTFNLPIDGEGPLPGIFQDEEAIGDARRFGHHYMNWGMSLSVRPIVVRDDEYGEPLTGNLKMPTYFQSDQKSAPGGDSTSTEDAMVYHQRIGFSTSHSWKFFRRAWGLVPGAIKEAEEPATETPRARALRELRFSLDRPVTSDAEITDDSGKWFVNRYQLQEVDASSPISIGAGITYDFIGAKARRLAEAKNADLERQATSEPDPAAAEALRNLKTNPRDLPSPWSGPSVGIGLALAGFSVSDSVDYDFYTGIPKTQTVAFGFPGFFATTLALAYKIAQEYPPPLHDLIRTKERSATIGSTLIPRVTTSITLLDREVESQTAKLNHKTLLGTLAPYRSVLAMEYLDSSTCWGLRFLREKDYGVLEENAKYLLELSIIFLGQKRNENVSPGLQRELLPSRS